MEELQDGSGDVRFLARLPAVRGLQQLGGVQPFLQVLNQLFTCTVAPVRNNPSPGVTLHAEPYVWS